MIMERFWGDLSAGVAVYAAGIDEQNSRNVLRESPFGLRHDAIIDPSAASRTDSPSLTLRDAVRPSPLNRSWSRVTLGG